MRSLKNQIFGLFLLFLFLCISSAVFTAYYYQKRSDLNELIKKSLVVENLLLKSIAEHENFINFETSNENFYKTSESKYVNKFHELYLQLNAELKNLKDASQPIEGALEEMDYLKVHLENYDTLFGKLKKLVLRRGFKNYGLEGEMRILAHELEDSTSIPLAEILMLRRHEKDFILRQNQEYIDRFNSLSKQIKEELLLRTNISHSNKAKTIQILHDYTYLFEELAILERMIGIKSNKGLKAKLNKESFLLQKSFNKLSLILSNHKDQVQAESNKFLLIFWICFVAIVLAFAYYIPKKLTRRITKLSKALDKLVNTNFSSKLSLPPQQKTDEISLLWNNFIKMEMELHQYINHFVEKVKEKTQELSEKNQQINLQNQEIKKQKLTTELQNKDLLDGLKYGWRIQHALLPEYDQFKSNVGDAFVLFAPKDIVSGDIYWTHKIKGENYFSVIDCTGHGVPGAFMSILALNAINDSISRKASSRPQEIIQKANNFVYTSLKYYIQDFNNSVNKDGMDLGFCKLNREEKKLVFVGASRPLYLFRIKKDNKPLDIGLHHEQYKVMEQEGKLLIEVKPLKTTIGTLSPSAGEEINELKIKVKSGDMLYLFTDGFPDQFGGPNNKKFMAKQFKSLLMEIFSMKVGKQKEILQNAFSTWKGDNEQVDDICVMGVRV